MWKTLCDQSNCAEPLCLGNGHKMNGAVIATDVLVQGAGHYYTNGNGKSFDLFISK
jgi:hypothetical protein